MNRPHRVIPTVNTGLEKVKEQLDLLKEYTGIYDKPAAAAATNTLTATRPSNGVVVRASAAEMPQECGAVRTAASTLANIASATAGASVHLVEAPAARSEFW